VGIWAAREEGVKTDSIVRILTTAAGLVLTAVVAASADPVRAVTGGSIVADRNGNGGVNIEGDRFSLQGRAVEGIGADLTCTPCAPGDGIPIHSRWAGDIGSDVAAVVDGTASSVFLGGDINLDGGTLVVPSGAGPTLTLQTPFTLASGSELIGFSDAARTMQLFRFGLSGSGLVTLRAKANGSLFDEPSLTWVFRAPAPAPVPEPATITLMALGGLAAATRRGWKYAAGTRPQHER
jgi:hypothetical protein